MKLVISRVEEWFDIDYPELDNYYICVKLLEKLCKRKIKGITYDKLKLINIVSPTKSIEMMKSIDRAIIYMVARGLIEKKKISDFRTDLFITELGKSTLIRIEERKNEIE